MRETWAVVRREHALRRATLGATVVFVGGTAALTGSPRGLAYAVFIAVGALLVAGVHARWPLPRAVLWSMVGLAVAHLAGGLLPSPDPTQVMLYETWVLPGALKLDQLIHAYGTGVTTWAGWHAAAASRPRRRALIAVTIGLGAGVANELIEIALDLALPTLVGDLTNMRWDLVFNAAGATIALLLVDRSQQRSPATRAA